MSHHNKKERKEPSFFEVKKHKGIFAWMLSTDHKRIGLMYLYLHHDLLYCWGYPRTANET